MMAMKRNHLHIIDQIQDQYKTIEEVRLWGGCMPLLQ